MDEHFVVWMRLVANVYSQEIFCTATLMVFISTLPLIELFTYNHIQYSF